MALLLVVICAGLYARTIDFPLVFDDEMYLKNNPLSRDPASFGYLANFVEFANRPAKLGLDPDLATNFVMRPVAYATFYLNYWLGGYQPRGYHMGNIAIHAVNAVLVSLLAGLLLLRMGVAAGSRWFISFTAALLFVVHPMATESVTYIAQRFTSLGTLFYLLCLLLHFTAHNISRRGWRWTVRGMSVMALLLGMQSYESTFTAPLMAVLLDVILLRAPWRAALKKALPLLLCLPVIPLLLLAVSAAQNHGTLSLHHAINLTNSKDQPWPYADYLITQTTVVLDYLRRLFWPAGLNLDPDWPFYRSLVAWPVLRALAVFAALSAGAWWLFRRRLADARLALPLAFVVWFFVTIAPSSGAAPLPDLMAEHRSYLSSIGIFIVVAFGLDALRRGMAGRSWLRLAAPALVVTSVIALSVTTWQRNEVWRSAITLWQDTAAKSPAKFRVWANLAVAYAVDGRLEEALACSRKSETLEPRFIRAFVQTLSYLNALNRNEEVLSEIQRRVTANETLGHVADVQYHYAIALVNTGRSAEGVKMLDQLVTLLPTHHLSHIALGLVYQQQHRQDKALKHLRIAAQLQPSNKALADILAETEKQGNLVAK